MRLSKALVLVLDTETTGVDLDVDEICELGGVYFRGHERLGPPLCSRVRPSRFIPTSATQIHGISNEDVEDAPPWSEIGRVLGRHIAEARPVVVGYNIGGFDGPIIDAENARAGLGWRMPPCVDPFPFALWHHRGDRSRKLGALCAAYGIELPEKLAHSADADALVTGHLLAAMVSAGVIPDDVEGAFAAQRDIEARLAEEEARYGRFIFPDRTDGRLRVGLGKHAGALLDECDHDYLRWMLGRPDMPVETRAAINRVLGQVEQIGLF